MKKCICFFIISISYLVCIHAYAEQHITKIKVAVLENLMSQKFSSSEYAKQYLMGLDVAKKYAKSKGVDIEYGHFFYDSTPLSILDQVKQMKAWEPDVILGPRLSDNFLILQYYIKNILVLSPLASADAVQKMPDNFYSFSAADKDTANAMLEFLKYKYPKASYFNLVEADCKSCTDISNDFVQEDEKEKPGDKIIQNKYISDQVKTIEIKKLLKGYKSGDIIVLPSSSYSANILMVRISKYLPTTNLVFVGGDNWGKGIIEYLIKMKEKQKFIAYRVSPSINKKSDAYKKFVIFNEKENHNNIMPDTTAFRSFQMIYNLIASLNYADYSKDSVGKAILSGFVNYPFKNDSKTKQYDIYQIKNKQEKVIYFAKVECS